MAPLASILSSYEHGAVRVAGRLSRQGRSPLLRGNGPLECHPGKDGNRDGGDRDSDQPLG